MQPSTPPEEDTSSPTNLPEIATEATLAQLRSQLEQTRSQLLQVSTSTIPDQSVHDSLQSTLDLARRARNDCQLLRTNLTSLADHYRQIQHLHAEIRRRQQLVHTLKSTLHHVHRIYLLSKTIQSANSNADHAQVSRACILFEALTTSHPLFDPQYKCLHPISDRIAHAAVQSMRLLRSSLRAACQRFDPVVYVKCMREFDKLGAGKQFAQHVLQIFEEEGRAVYDDALALDSRPSQRVLSLFSRLSVLSNQFSAIVEFHDEKGEGDGDNVMKEVGKELLRGELPLERFGQLAVTMVGGMRVALLNEQTTSLLHLFEAAQSFCEHIKASYTSAIDGLASLIRAEEGVEVEAKGAGRLRRRPSISKLGSGVDSMLRRQSGRVMDGRMVADEIRKVVKSVALDCVSACHVRHAEELQMITESPESWIRIRILERDVRSLFRDLFAGLDGRIAEKILGPAVDGGEERETCEPEFEEISCSSVTFTTASMAMLRWVSEYATIGVTVPDVFADALSDITDIFLILVHASIDMKSRIRTYESEPFLKLFEDLLLERPRDKSIADFIPVGLKQTFEAFLDRYGSTDIKATQDADIGQSKDRWGWSAPVHLPLYSNAAGQLFANRSVCTLSIVRQCVAAEGIGTFCEVLARFVAYLEQQLGNSGRFRDGSWPLKLASLKSAIGLGRAVQQAFYELLAWDIIGGWQAVSAVAETCRSFHQLSDAEKDETASTASSFVSEMMSRIQNAYSVRNLPPAAAERISMVVCQTAMSIVLEGFSRVQHCTETAGASQILVDLRTLDLALVEHTGMHPCPGRARTEMYVKATFLDEEEVMKWAQRHKRKLNLSDDHIKALIVGSRHEEVPIVDQIITP